MLNNNMPFRAIAKMTGGMVNLDMAEGMVTAVNGHFVRGVIRVVRGFFANKKANKAYEGLLKAEKVNHRNAGKEEKQ